MAERHAVLLGVVGAKHSAQVSIVLGVAVVFAGQEVLSDRGDAGGGCVKEGQYNIGLFVFNREHQNLL